MRRNVGKKVHFIWLFVPIWGALLLLGMGGLMMYQMKPGTQLPAPSRIPGSLQSTLPSLKLFIHSECPCSQATLSDLERIEADARGRLDISIYFEIPEGSEHSPLVARAKSIANCRVIIDHEGHFARLYGAATSGFAVLFDSGGKKIFQGGITAARAHEGDNAGQDAVLQFLAKGTVPVKTTPVFGCSLGDLGADIHGK